MAELPFVEKYRPVSLKDLCGDTSVKALRAFVRSGSFPLALIFHGEYGTGKTTAAKAMVRDYYVNAGLYLPSASFRDIRSGTKISPGYESLFPPVLYVDASVTRDIDTIRGLVRSFMQTVAPKGLVKFVIFDEADSLGFDAQRALRALIERYPNTRTVYTANVLEKIDPAIRDRAAGGVLEFKYPAVEEVADYLKSLATKERILLHDEVYAVIAEQSKSVREAVGKLGTEIAIVKAEEMPVAIPTPAIPTEKPIPEVAGPIEVWMKLRVEGGVEADKEGKPRVKTPEYFAMATTFEEYKKPLEERWERPLCGMFGTKMLIQFLKESQLDYDLIEDMTMTWGDDWTSIKESLAANPPPFNQYSTFRIKWKPEDVEWTESAKQAWDIYHYDYEKPELEAMSKHSINVIAAVKEVSRERTKEATIENILAKQAYAEELEKPLEEVKPEISCAGCGALATTPIAAEYVCFDTKVKRVIFRDYFCRECAEKLERGEYPGGAVYPSVWKERRYDNVVCRRKWLEEKKPPITEVAADALEDLGKIGLEALRELERL